VSAGGSRPWPAITTSGPLEPARSVPRSEARLFALQIVRDPGYRSRLMEKARAGRLPPPIEEMLWAYAYGRPPERMEIGPPGAFQELEDLPMPALALRAKQVAEFLEIEAAAEERGEDGPLREAPVERAAQRRTDAVVEIALRTERAARSGGDGGEGDSSPDEDPAA